MKLLLLVVLLVASARAIVNPSFSSSCWDISTSTAINEGADCYPRTSDDVEPCANYVCSSGFCVATGTFLSEGTPCDTRDDPCADATCQGDVCTSLGSYDNKEGGSCYQLDNDCLLGTCGQHPTVQNALSCQTTTTEAMREDHRCTANACVDADLSFCSGGTCEGPLLDCYDYIIANTNTDDSEEIPFNSECWRNTLCVPSRLIDGQPACASVAIPGGNVEACDDDSTDLCLVPFDQNNPNTCDDGNECTESDQCGGGRCLAFTKRCNSVELFAKEWINPPKDRECYDSFSDEAECRFLNGTCYLPLFPEGAICHDEDNSTNFDVCVPAGVCTGFNYANASLWVHFDYDVADDSALVTFGTTYAEQINNVAIALAAALGLPYSSAVRANQVWPTDLTGAFVRYEIFDLKDEDEETAEDLVQRAIEAIGSGDFVTDTNSVDARAVAPSVEEASSVPFSQLSTIIGTTVATGVMIIVIAACFLYYGTKASRGGKFGSQTTESRTGSSVSSSSSRG